MVVLGARNHYRLERVQRELLAGGVPHVAVRESAEPWCGQLMAIGLVPGEREALRPYVRDLQTFQQMEGES